jgi:hypothetical protein
MPASAGDRAVCPRWESNPHWDPFKRSGTQGNDMALTSNDTLRSLLARVCTGVNRARAVGAGAPDRLLPAVGPISSVVVAVVPADGDLMPVLADDLLDLAGVFRQPSDVADQEEVGSPRRHVGEELTAPFRDADAECDLRDGFEGDHPGTVAPVFQFPYLPSEIVTTVGPSVEDRSAGHRSSLVRRVANPKAPGCAQSRHTLGKAPSSEVPPPQGAGPAPHVSTSRPPGCHRSADRCRDAVDLCPHHLLLTVG